MDEEVAKKVFDDYFDNYLHNRVDLTITRYKRLEAHNEKVYQIVQWSIIILSLLTSISIGIGQFFDNILLKIIALITSLIVTSLASVQKTFDYQDRASHYRKLVADLQRELYLFQANRQPYSMPGDKRELLVERVEDIIKRGIDKRPIYSKALIGWLLGRK